MTLLPHQRTATAERATRAGKYLAKRYGPLFRRWAAARRADWRVDHSWGVDEIVEKWERLCTDQIWRPLAGVPPDIADVDLWMRRFLGALSAIPKSVEPPIEITIDEATNLVRLWLPTIRRERVRAVLFTMTRYGWAFRECRGVYSAEEFGLRYKERRRWDEMEEELHQKWELQARLYMLTLFTHYMLPHVAVYRKAGAFGMSERNFYYGLNSAFDRVTEPLDWKIRPLPKPVQS